MKFVNQQFVCTSIFVGFEVESLNYGKAGSVQVEIIHKQEQSDNKMTNLSNLEVN